MSASRRGSGSRDLSDLAAMMSLCPRPLCLARWWCVLTSGLRCCSTSWRSWPVSATRLMGASWRSSPSWSATSCGAPRVRGRWRRWWPGRSARRRETPTRSPLWRTGFRSFPAARRVCGRVGCRWIRSGSSRRARVRDLMSTMRSWPRSHGQPAAHRGQAGTATRTRTRFCPRTGALDHQDLRRAVHHLADQTSASGRGEVRRGPGVAS